MSEAEDLVRLASADNFRDVAGPGHQAGDGTPLRTGVFYRSNELRLSDEDAASIAALGVSAIHDLRTRAEIEHRPGVEVPGRPGTTSTSSASRWRRSPSSRTRRQRWR